jgi:hypothetical protein
MGEGWAGHEKGDGALLLSKNPRYIFVVNGFCYAAPVSYEKFREEAWTKSDVEMLNHPDFPKFYQVKHYRLDDKRWINYFERRAPRENLR